MPVCVAAVKNTRSVAGRDMANKEFILQRIFVYAGTDFDPSVDEQVENMLRAKFNVRLPQRTSMDESLKSATSDHEIIQLILQYRSMD